MMDNRKKDDLVTDVEPVGEPRAESIEREEPDAARVGCEEPIEGVGEPGFEEGPDAPEPEEAAIRNVRKGKEGKTSQKRKSKGEANCDLGRRGEDAAARFLYRRGYEIVERNWKCAAGEADIIARDGEAVVFVEVKTRTSLEKGLPSDAVDKKKREKYEKIAALFLKDFDAVDVPVRFDVISLLVIGPDRALVRHHINAFAVG